MTRRSLRYILPAFLALLAIESSAQTGAAGLSFLKLGVGARALAMGEAYSAIANDPSATYYNPAALSLAATPRILLMHKEWIQGTRTEFIGASSTTGRFSFGLGANSTSVDDIEVRTAPGPAIGTFDARNASIGLSGSYLFEPELSIGVTMKFLYEKIYVYDASGLAFDFGGVYKTPWDVTLALAVNNLGSLSELDKESSTLPTVVRGGAAYQRDLEQLDSRLTLSTDIVSFTAEQKSHVHVGAELTYKNTFSARAGYQTGYDAKGFSAGVGIRYDIVTLDYAFVPFEVDLGTTHTFSIGINFE